MIPITGSSARIPKFTHRNSVGFICAWIIWLSYIALTPTEVQAVIQYASFYFPGLTHSNSSLTTDGYITATICMLIISFLNTYSLRWLIKVNNLLTVLKLLIPIIIILVILALFSTHHSMIHPAHKAFNPHGLHGILGAIATGGIVMAIVGIVGAFVDVLVTHGARVIGITDENAFTFHTSGLPIRHTANIIAGTTIADIAQNILFATIFHIGIAIRKARRATSDFSFDVKNDLIIIRFIHFEYECELLLG